MEGKEGRSEKEERGEKESKGDKEREKREKDREVDEGERGRSEIRVRREEGGVVQGATQGRPTHLAALSASQAAAYALRARLC